MVVRRVGCALRPVDNCCCKSDRFPMLRTLTSAENAQQASGEQDAGIQGGAHQHYTGAVRARTTGKGGRPRRGGESARGFLGTASRLGSATGTVSLSVSDAECLAGISNAFQTSCQEIPTSSASWWKGRQHEAKRIGVKQVGRATMREQVGLQAANPRALHRHGNAGLQSAVGGQADYSVNPCSLGPRKHRLATKTGIGTHDDAHIRPVCARIRWIRPVKFRRNACSHIPGGGAHANRCLDIQDCMVMIPAAKSYGEVLEITAEIYHAAGALLKKKGRLAGVADEGGWWPDFSSNEEALQLLCEAIEFAGECPGDRVVISLDIAATELYHNGVYELGRDGKVLDSSQFINLLGVWLDNYPIVSIEDPLAESDIEGMIQFTQRFGDRVQIVGDDFLATNAKLVGRAIRQKACNTVLLKPNQAGTVLETIETYKIARKNKWGTIISARSGETEDVTIAHLAVGLGCGQFKVGSFSRSERMAKWNECLRIEEQIGKSNFNASSPLHKTWWADRQAYK